MTKNNSRKKKLRGDIYKMEGLEVPVPISLTKINNYRLAKIALRKPWTMTKKQQKPCRA